MQTIWLELEGSGTAEERIPNAEDTAAAKVNSGYQQNFHQLRAEKTTGERASIVLNVKGGLLSIVARRLPGERAGEDGKNFDTIPT